jgi:hypothetical protein
MLEIKLIHLYYYVCKCYSTQLRWQVQRFSPNSFQGHITDEELITIYLFAVAFEQKCELKQIYAFTLRYWSGWFPTLGSYQSFSNRLNRLSDCLALLSDMLMAQIEGDSSSETVLIDSLPIITCSASRRPKVALELTGKGYCTAKKLYYHGCKLHLLSGHRPKQMPLPRQAGFTPAHVHDLTAIKPVLEEVYNTTVFADKAYADKAIQQILLKNNARILIPPKKVKAKPTTLEQFDKAANVLLGRAVSSIRQPIESLINWLHQKVNIQNASKVRSDKGLKLHIFGKLAAALVAITFF